MTTGQSSCFDDLKYFKTRDADCFGDRCGPWGGFGQFANLLSKSLTPWPALDTFKKGSAMALAIHGLIPLRNHGLFLVHILRQSDVQSVHVIINHSRHRDGGLCVQ